MWFQHARQLRRDVDRPLSFGSPDVDKDAPLFVGAVQSVVNVRAGIVGIFLAVVVDLLTVGRLVAR